MTAWAYYNEFDPFAAAWLRELIKDGLIAPGEVDERSIEDVSPNELRSFRQCHFFAGIGVWSLAARRAGWRDDEALWSGSCSCQPFSAAGKGIGFADERHVWPSFFHLIEQCRPNLVVGEQVARRDGDIWLDLVQSDLEATDYAFGAIETCACGFGAPHIRSRNYWMGHANGNGTGRDSGAICSPVDWQDGQHRADDVESSGAFDGVADAQHDDGRTNQPIRRSDRRAIDGGGGQPMRMADSDSDRRRAAREAGRDQSECNAQPSGAIFGVADTSSERWVGWRASEAGNEPGSLERSNGFRDAIARPNRPGPTNGYWRNADWLGCRDEKWRPVESGTFPLADAGTFRNRVGLLRGAGNAITIGQAEGFLIAVRHALKLG